MHLLLTYQYPALEEFLLSRVEKDIHTALSLLWLLQSSYKDLKSTPLSPAFPLCQRVFNRVQAIIFNTQGSEGNEILEFTKNIPVQESVLPALVGIGQFRRI